MSVCVSTAQARAKCCLPRNRGPAFFQKKSTQNGSCEMSMCVSTAQARAKCCLPRNRGPAFSCKFPHKMALVKCPCRFRPSAVPQLILVALAVVFEADVPSGNWVTAGFDSPLARPSTCIGGRREWRVK